MYDSSAQGGSAFYSLRVSKTNYVGATYEYQRLVSYPTVGQNETQTHAVLFFYTLYPTTLGSPFLCFGGPQYSDTVQAPIPRPSLRSRHPGCGTPAAGASVSWQGQLSSFALSYSHLIAGGGGLIGAVQLDSVSASVRQQITRPSAHPWPEAMARMRFWGAPSPGPATDHSVSGTATLQRVFGQQPSLQLGQRLDRRASESCSSGTRGCTRATATSLPSPQPRHEPGICFSVLSILKTAGKIIHG